MIVSMIIIRKIIGRVLRFLTSKPLLTLMSIMLNLDRHLSFKRVYVQIILSVVLKGSICIGLLSIRLLQRSILEMNTQVMMNSVLIGLKVQKKWVLQTILISNSKTITLMENSEEKLVKQPYISSLKVVMVRFVIVKE